MAYSKILLLLMSFTVFAYAESFYGLKKLDAVNPLDDNKGELVSVDSIPFVKNEITISIDTTGIVAKHLYLLGCVNSNKQATPGWGGTDDAVNYFVGDRIGDLKLEYNDGTIDSIPLVFGYTVWWKDGYLLHSLPFSEDPNAQSLLDNALCVANAARYYQDPSRAYFIRIALRDKPLMSIALQDNPEKNGFFVMDGLTFEVACENDIDKSRYVFWENIEISGTLNEWLNKHTINSADSYPSERMSAVKAITDFLYTYPLDVTEKAVAAIMPEKRNFNGPVLEFKGSVEAEILSKVFYDNAIEVHKRIDEQGLVHESKKDAIYYGTFGSWRQLGAFHNKAYTRNHTIHILSSIGLVDVVERAIDFFDHWMMYFPEAFPEVKLDGKPVPGHCPVIANLPHIYFDELRHVGWPTKYSTRDFGNPENDGHGILMLGRYRYWLKTGQSTAWVKKHWLAINEAAEYIRWALDNPELSFSEHGLLYNETEAGMMKASLYCDMPCYLGLLAYSQMAESVGEMEKSVSWRKLAIRLKSAMEKYYPLKLEPYGEIWDPAKTADWNHQQGVVAPVLFGSEMYGYDTNKIKGELPDQWFDRAERSYLMVRDKLEPAYCAPRGLGYGQNYFLQTSLLLDRMQDAGKFINWLARFCYAPRHPHPYRVPEGISMKSDGSVWRRWGDLGNLYQMNGTVNSLLMIAGIDDYDPRVLKIIPRIPLEWNHLSVTSYPVRTMSNGISKTAVVDIELKHQKSDQQVGLILKSDIIMDDCHVRLGPIPLGSKKLVVKLDDRVIDCELTVSGDSKWCWVVLENASRASIEVRYQ